MSVLYILIIISIGVAAVFLFAFIWSVKQGQYEDDYTPSVRILFDSSEEEDVRSDRSSQEGKDDQAGKEKHHTHH